jgi:hypothetical protein
VASPSSTSSSELTAPLSVRLRGRTDRLPWGFFSAIVLVCVFELVLRALNPIGIVTSSEDDERAYRGVVPELLAFGAPDVAIVGSSRARRGVTAPALKQAFAYEGQDVRVGNFALGAAKAEETEAAVRRLLEATPPPRLVVWPVAPRDLTRELDPPGHWVRFLWRPSDWWRARKTLGRSADRHLPEVLRNEASRHSWLMRYRPFVRDLIEGSQRRPMLHMFSELIRGERDETPMLGAVDSKHLTAAATMSRDVTPDGVKRYLGRNFTERDWLVSHQSRSLEGAIEALEEARVPVIFIELPTHPLMEEVQPPGTTKKFRKFMQKITKRHRVKFIRLSDLDAEFERADFYEQSHLNYIGAQKYTRAITKAIVNALPRDRP